MIWGILVRGGHLGGHLEYSMKTYLERIFNAWNGFLDPQNISFDTKFNYLCAIVREIWGFLVRSSHLGSHLGGHLEYSMNTYLQRIFNAYNGFFDPQKLSFDTKFNYLCAVVREIWGILVRGGHLGGHLEYSMKTYL